MANHLAWLDQEIKKAQSSTIGLSEEPADESPRTTPSIPPPRTIPVQSTQDIKIPELVSNSPAFGQTQRFGCIALAILLAAGAVFVFWILPGMIYN